MVKSSYAALFAALMGASLSNVAEATSPLDGKIASAYFNVSATNLADGVIVSGNGWTAPTEGIATNDAVNGAITLEDVEPSLQYAPASNPANGIVRVVVTATPVACTSALTAGDYSGAQTAIYVLDNAGTLKWMGLVGGAFVELSGHTPVAETKYDIAIDFDYTASPAKMRYSVRSAGAGDYTVLNNNSDEWLANSASSSTKLDYLQFAGNGVLNEFSGATWESTVPAVDVGGDVDVNVDASWIADNGIDASRDPNAIGNFLKAEGANGLENWKNYALQLPVNDAAQKPVMKAVQDKTTGKITFNLFNAKDMSVISAKAGTGMNVQYRVDKCDTPNGTFTSDSEYTALGTAISVDAPAAPAKVKYHKLRLKFANPDPAP